MHLFVSVVWIALPFTAFTNPLPQESLQNIDPPSINSYTTGTDIKPGDWLASALPANLNIDNPGEAEPELTKSNTENRNEEPLIIAEEPPPDCTDSYGQVCCGRRQYSGLEYEDVPEGHGYFSCSQSESHSYPCDFEHSGFQSSGFPDKTRSNIFFSDPCPKENDKRCCKELNSHTLPNFVSSSANSIS